MQKFNFHQHTYRCKHADFLMQDEDYVKEYIEMGFEKIAFTDHCPEKNEIDKRQTMRMKYSQKDEYLSSIKSLKEKYKGKIEIQTGYEVEYLPGEEENLMELKSETDKIVLGQHFIYDDEMQNLKILGECELSDNELLREAEYIKKAMELGIPDIIAHPDFYMLHRDAFGEKDAKAANKICSAAQEYDIPLEINLNNIYRRLFYLNEDLSNEERRERIKNVNYPCRGFWEIASKYNIRVLYGLDTHVKGQILHWTELVGFANEIIGEDIIEKLNFVEDI